MSIRFAPATGSRHNVAARLIAPQRCRGLRLAAANDNPQAASAKAAFDPLLVDALRHFAAHGLNAAPRARSAARAALAAGSRAGFDHWTAITGLFDPRLARGTGRGEAAAQD
jgi:hypothetical protein